ncbi:hypothetical protein [Paraburkholderia sp. J12]|uniref:hypothetical protein n=1 Tax=Paraburkholderia sp. J12 TaxID=2805432 RepID=UPI002ABE1958|nr:hypothetical protein [Paraburkholderia sp. J12]
MAQDASILMADIADNADPTSPNAARAARGVPPKRRVSPASALPADTGNTPARVASPVAQPAEPPRDESTFDLFGDDPTHRPAPSMRTPDVHSGQEELSGVQQPVVERAEAAPGAEVESAVQPALAPVAAAPRRSTRTRAAAVAAALEEPALREPESAATDDVKPDDGASAPPEIADTGSRIAPAVPPAPEDTRTKALAQAVDALHGRIADQGRAAAELSRRMKWTLAAAAGALVVTVAAGVAQTVALVRLASETSAQQQHLAQMMQDQQAALAGALARLAAPPVAASAPAPAAPVPAVREAPPHRTQHAVPRAHHARPASQTRGR